MTEYLDLATIDQLRQAAVDVGLDAPEVRALLLAGINRQFVAQLPRLASPGDQLFSDLLAMQTATLDAGEVPLEQWLANAVSRLGMRVERKLFEAALEQVADRREREQPRDDPPGGEERLVHGYDLLPLDFVTGALRVSSSVARLKVPRFEAGVRRMTPGTQQEMNEFGTGWMLAPGLLITNFHVVNARSKSEANATPDDLNLQAKGTVAEFDYNSEGVMPATEAAVALRAFDQGLDFAVLEVTEQVVRPPLRLASTTTIEALATAQGPVNIIQHAGGAPKTVGIRNNLIASHSADELRYFTDTMAGSSGSPVCADDWEVVALHKAWTFVAQEVQFQGKATAWVNRGTRIDRIVQHLKDNSAETWAKLQT